MMRLVYLLLLSSALVSACGKPDPPRPSRPEETPADAGRESASPTWPPELPDDGSIDLEENILARNYYVVLDGSGSMQEKRCSGGTSKSVASKKALEEFAATVPAEANLGLMAFDTGGVTERVPLGRNNRDHFTKAVDATGANSNTPLRSAISLGLGALEKQAQRQLGYGEYHLVIVTDGHADKGQDPTQVVNRIVDGTAIIVHTIGFCIGEEHSLNQPGRTIYKAADNPEELTRGLKTVLAEAETFDVTDFK